MEPIFFESAGQFRGVAGRTSRDRDRGAGRLPQEGGRPMPTHDMVGVGRPGVVLRLDRRPPKQPRPRHVHDPVHAAEADEHLEHDQCRQGRGPHPARADARAGLAAYARRDPAKTGVYSFENEDRGLGPEFEAEFRRDSSGLGVVRASAAQLPAHGRALGPQRQARQHATVAAGDADRRLGRGTGGQASPAAGDLTRGICRSVMPFRVIIL